MGEVSLIFASRVLVAALLGGIIGIERELSEKPAGIKDILLISVASCAISIISILVATKNGVLISDPARISAQIIPGIGFICAGVILKDRRNIYGLTSAATIWVVTAIGLVCGLGYLLEATLITITLLSALTLLKKVNKLITKKFYKIVISYDSLTIVDQLNVTQVFSKGPFKLSSIKSKKDGNTEFRFIAHNRNLHKLKYILENSPVEITSHQVIESS